MPTYSYACKACDHAFDIRQSFTDDALTMCPECGEPTLRKVLHPVGIAFKGSGFYRNDSKASSASPAKKETETKRESNGSSTGSEAASVPTSGSGGSSASGGSSSSSPAAASSTSS